MMKVKVIKRDGRQADFDINKIIISINNASNGSIFIDEIKALADKILLKIQDKKGINPFAIYTSVEEIENLTEEILKSNGYDNVLKSYTEYRNERTKVRDVKSNLMKTISDISVETDRDNANVGNNFSSKLLRIASEASKWRNLANMPKDMARLHENGDIYYHDLDSFNLTTNCLHIPLKKILESGINTGYGTLREPKRIGSAADLSCIILQSAQNDHFGGQAYPNFDNDLVKYVDMSRKEIYNEISCIGYNDPEDVILARTEQKLRRTVSQAMQDVVCNLNTMHSRAGSQVPFSSVNIGIPMGTEQEKKDAALIAELFLEEYEKGLGKGEQPIFPSIIFRTKEGINLNPEDPYYYLYKVACRVASKRMNPTFFNIDADFNKEYYEKGYTPALMGCRTYLMSNVNGEPGVEGRGNIAPTTINLPRIGILAKGDLTKFFDILSERLDQAKESLLYRYDVLKNLKVKDLPFTCGQKLMRGSEDLNDNDSIEPVLKQGTWGIGFIGLAETLVALIGKHHGESEEARMLGFKIIKFIRDYTDRTIKETHLNFSCYCTPAEGLSGKFILKDREKFGEIKGVTDKKYYTNSFHVPVGYSISLCDKVKIEAPYHKLGNGGHISYVELDDYPTPDMIERIVTSTFKNTNMSYLGINFHIKYCKKCGTYLKDTETECPSCGSNDIQGISRVTGYLSLDERFGPGKYYERKDRTAHMGDHKVHYTLDK